MYNDIVRFVPLRKRIRSNMDSSDIAVQAKEVLRDCSKYALFDASGTILAASYQVRGNTASAWTCWSGVLLLKVHLYALLIAALTSGIASADEGAR